MTRYQGDPRWMTAKFSSDCSKCKRLIHKGETIFYYPQGKRVLCADVCGPDASRDFQSHAADEDGY